MLSKGYEVCGVIYENDKEMALHTISNNYKDLEDIRDLNIFKVIHQMLLSK